MENPIYFLTLFSLFVIFNGMTNVDAKERQIYIVYLGDKPHDDHVRIAESHHDILADVVGSKEESKKLMVYNYKHSFSGFAAKLTKEQAKKLAEMPGVLRVLRDGRHKRQNTRSWSSLGLSHDGTPNNILHQTNMGDGIIIGVIDSGIWPESKAFSDVGLGPIPARWKGVCKSSGMFDASKHCNRKIIGARWYVDGYLHETGVKAEEFKDLVEGIPSPIDVSGHGTHVASTAAGSFVSNVSYYGFNMGTFRGGAPRARLAIYKACWDQPEELCQSSDILAAMDDAVRDGVDVISVSLGGDFPHEPEVSPENAIAIGSFHAVAHGIPVVCAAGNNGPTTSTTADVAPWMISVAASTLDRAFPTPITLGDNTTIMGRGLVMGKRVDFTELVEEELDEGKTEKKPNKKRIKGLKGAVVISFFKDNTADYPAVAARVAKSGGLALIIVKPLDDSDLFAYGDSMRHAATKIPIVEVDFEGGNQILEYLEKSSEATVMVGPSSVLVGKPLTAKIAGFSSRGPNALAPEILKPDIAAPGASILAAVPPEYEGNDNGFAFMSGTSMAAPHISGIVALLKALHPQWSPAAIRSALVTTAWNEDTQKTLIFAEGSPAKLADAFDYGGGIVNPNAAAYPGLVYDMNKEDYLNYLCSQKYNISDIYNATKDTPWYNTAVARSICQNRYISLSDLNLPSIIIPNLKNFTTVRRRVTNVGPSNSVYKVMIKSPPGTKVSIKPDVLVFNSNSTVLDFVVTVTTEQEVNTGFTFGSLSWTDGKYYARSPIAIYIVYLGDKPDDDHVRIAESHHDILADVVGSKEEAKKLMVYNYKHSFSGFAAKLTEAQAKKLAELPGVLRVLPDRRHKKHNTRSWSSLGLSHEGTPNNLLHQTNMGDGIIVGVLDSGIWPESKAFNDEGLGAIPAHWKGVCKSDGLFDASKHCNRKIIGARWYVEGYLHDNRTTMEKLNETVKKSLSPLDDGGHGTHVASTIAGSFVSNVNYHGFNMGTFRGGAPRARLAIYKVCWNIFKEGCSDSDILAGIDDAVHDGVDVISMSLGGHFPHDPEVSPENGMAIGAFHAVAHGIPVVCAAGNDGPTVSSTTGTAPWMITVAASSIDRAFPAPITLGDNKTIMGRSLIAGKRVGFAELVHKEVPDKISEKESIKNVTRKVVIAFFKDGSKVIPEFAAKVAQSGGLALIVVRPRSDAASVKPINNTDPETMIPIVEVDFEGGNQILKYLKKSSQAIVMVGPSGVFVGKPLTPKIGSFSSRGPNALAPEILKPDIAAPGASILAAVPPFYKANDNGFAFMSGTSMATPHVSGIVTLLRASHPHWSPAAIRSAIVTTAWNEDSYETPIFAEGSPAKLADAFDYGGGIVNPNIAEYPGLIYDMNKEDYMNYLCSQEYKIVDIYNATKETTFYNNTAERLICQNRYISLLDLNLPSITIPYLSKSITVRRTVTNVGPSNSVYKATIKSPVGTKISVRPRVLRFNSNTTTIDYVVKVTAKQKMNTGYMFGRDDMENRVCFLVFLSLFLIVNGMGNVDPKERQIYIVYLGDKPHDDHVLITESHHDILADVVGSKEEAKKLMVYNYKHSFSGFAARLTKAQAKKLAELPGVLRVLPDGHHKRQNTRSWSSLDLSHERTPNNLLHQTNMGDGIIVGVIDSGIWPESKAFSDEGLGPIPARWKGVCKSDGLFDASKHCNRKIIGARWYVKGYLDDNEVTMEKFNETFKKSPSALDDGGHGTHVASTIAGSFVSNVSYYGFNMGTFRGGAPKARLAIYMVCWDVYKDMCSNSDILAAIDDAVHDGVDVISMSLGDPFPHTPEVSPVSGVAIGSFHAVAHGIPVVCAGGNEGPTVSSITGIAPWMISVAASTIDRAFPTPIALGDNKTIMGRSLIVGKRVDFTELIHKEVPDKISPEESIENVKGKVVVAFLKDNPGRYHKFAEQVARSGGLALIVVRPRDDVDSVSPVDDKDPEAMIPIVEVDFEGGNQILNSQATVMVGLSSVFVGKPLTPKIGSFSSRGPNALAPEILKPDIAAPGASILAAVRPFYPANDNGFAFMSGTSMATPHVSGIVALLRALRPHWSPAAIRSALVTTAWNKDSYETPIFAEGSPAKLADAFDYGGGIVNPNAAAYPGLVYDMNKQDYLNYLCSQEYNIVDIYNATKETPAYNSTAERLICQNRYLSLLDLNLPSITIPYLSKSITVKRRVTNVGPSNSVYEATIKAPVGTKVSVRPRVLRFSSNTTTVDFVVKVIAKQNMITGYMFGSLTWSDGKHYEINHSGAGGLWAELVSNRGFEAGGQNIPSNISPWTILGDESSILVSTDRSSCFDRNKVALKMEVLCDTNGDNICPAGGVGVYNPGFWGMNIEQGKTYKVTFYVRSSEPLQMSVSFVGTNGLQTLATSDITTSDVTNWTKKEVLLEAQGTDSTSRLKLTTAKKCTIWLDQVSAMPLSTHKGHGFRNDLFNMLADLKPGFIRFPGGSFVEGDWLTNAFRWRETIGAWEERPGHFGDAWQYWTDDGLGYFEYLQVMFLALSEIQGISKLAEDLGALPVWVFNNGISHNEQVDASIILPFVQDILDAIEFARGDPASTWGSVRASMGHEEPFDLRYVAVGNQDCGNKNYRGNYLKFYNAIKRAYPDIKIITNCDSSSRPLDHPADLYDFHVYTNANSMFSMAHNFDHTSRSGPKAFVSEYAVTGNDAGRGSLLKALAEAGFLLGLETNSDVVEMASNAPLFVNTNDRRFNPDAIVFDSSKVYGTPSYWMQHFFKESNNATLLNSKLQSNSSTSLIASTISWKDPQDNKSYLRIKVVNFGSNIVTLKVSVDGLDGDSIEAAGSTMTTLTSSNVMDENSFNEPKKVAPIINPLKDASNKMNVILPPYSLTSIDLLRESNIIQVAGSDGVHASI
ncbi:hypothetical protein BUALT_Bualt16G0108200 [Buddleja alternifolia]|uniref:non-reducing end alpha-L-arabinofuranosidase n=1 Tax=Buddleja alternifolia TaxID=168488 RepID=A0AAV6WCH5_9LAMI|nr:hypothetical protein BUALT_Bualt16G0108200 [Buddleja alternifolia]